MADPKLRGPRQADNLRRPTVMLYHERLQITTVLAAHASSNPHYAPTCGHGAPRMRHVEALDGPARYLCRRCALAALAVEVQVATRTEVRAQFDALFVGCRLRITRSGGGFAPPAAAPARI